jgi:hypothetical protein
MDYLSLKAGDVDHDLNKTIKEIIIKGNDYIVYMDTESTIQWGALNIIGSGFDKIQNQVSYWELICNKIFLKQDEAYSYKALLAEALARVLSGSDIKDAQSAINSATDLIKMQRGPIIRQAYVSGSYAMAFPLFLILLVGLLYLDKFGTAGIGLSKTAIEFIVAGLLGGIGAFISTMTGVTKYDPDISFNNGIYWLDGSFRVIYGVLAGALIVLGIKASFITLITVPDNIYALPFLSAIGGASEKILPNIIKKMEENIGKD